MKTVVRNVLVSPDDPYLVRPIAVKIRTDDGELMRRRLRRLLKDDQVVFIDPRLVDELIDDLDFTLNDMLYPWAYELLELKCGSDLALVRELRSKLSSEASLRRCNAVQYAKICFTCRDIFQKALNEVKDLKIVKEYWSCLTKYEDLEKEYKLIKHWHDCATGDSKSLHSDYKNLCDENRVLAKELAKN